MATTALLPAEVKKKAWMQQPMPAAQIPFPICCCPFASLAVPVALRGRHPRCRSGECLRTALQKHCTGTATTCNATTMHYGCHPGATGGTRTVPRVPCREPPALGYPGKKRNKPHTNSGIARHSPTCAAEGSNTRERCLEQNRFH